jgi:hypothetical protein
MSVVFGYVKRLIDETGVGTLFTHHMTKKGNSIRGSGDIRAFCDYALTIDKHALGVRCTHNKSRWAEPMPPFVAKFKHTKDSFDISFGGLIDSEIVNEDANEKLWREIMGFLSDDEAIEKTYLQEQVESMDICKERRFNQIMKWAIEMGYAEKVNGKPLRYRLNGVH